MIKHGQIKLHETPGVVTGKPSQRIVDDEPVQDDEHPVDPGLKKLAALVKDSTDG